MVANRLLLAFGFWMVFQPAISPVVAQSQTQSSRQQSVPNEARPVQFSISDTSSQPAFEDSQAATERATEEVSSEYPDTVSTDPGFPRKPIWERPGDFNGSKWMLPRYCQDDCFRAGWPGALRKRATCSMNSHYSAWYVGGGAGLPFLSNRHRTAEEGTWGLDYSLWKKPRTVWMKWTCGRHQGGEGAYETDHEPLF